VKGRRAAAAARAAAAEAARRSRAYRGGHDNGYSVHAPMAALALARLGASAQEVTAFAQHSLEDGARRFGVTPVPQPRGQHGSRARASSSGPELLEAVDVGLDATWGVLMSDGAWRLLAGDARWEGSLRGFFLCELEREGVADVLHRFLPEIMPGIDSRLFHGAIRLAYAVELGDLEEVAAALAYAVVSLTPALEPPAPQGQVAAVSAQEGFARLQELHHDHAVFPRRLFMMGPGRVLENSMAQASIPDLEVPVNFASMGAETTFFERYLEDTLEFYLQEANIYTLHAVTSLHALHTLRPYMGSADFAAGLRRHWRWLASLYVASKAPTLSRGSVLPAGKLPWPVLLESARTGLDDHEIKFLDTANQLSEALPGVAGRLHLAASTPPTGTRRRAALKRSSLGEFKMAR